MPEVTTFDFKEAGEAALVQPPSTEKSLVHTDRRSAAIVSTETVPVDPLMSLMTKFAANDSMSPEKAQMLMDIYINGQRRMQEMQDERAFRQAMSDFHKEPEVVRIVKDKKNKQYSDSPYASLGKEASVIVPLLAKHEINQSWGKLKQTDKAITLSCSLSHGLFCDDPVEVTLPVDTSGAKNGPQQIKSSITYARIITMECACGIAPIDSLAILNDDANEMTESDGETLDENYVADMLAKMEEATTAAELQAAYTPANKAAIAAGDKKAAAAFDAKKREIWRKKGGFK